MNSLLFGLANGSLAWAIGEAVQLTSQLVRMSGFWISADEAADRANREAAARATEAALNERRLQDFEQHRLLEVLGAISEELRGRRG